MKSPRFPSLRFLSPLLAALFFWGACLVPSQAKPAKSKIKDLNDTVASNRILTKFAAVVQGSGLGSFLSSRGPFILFAPTNSAFTRLPPGTLEALLQPQNKATLQRIVLFHLVYGKFLTSKDLLKVKSLPSCDGPPLTIHTRRSGTQMVMTARILHADIHCANGLLNEIDTLLIPPGVVLPAPVAPKAPVASVAPAAPINAASSGTNDDTAPPEATPAPEETNAIPVAPAATTP